MLHLKLLKSSHWQSSNVEFIRRQLTTHTSQLIHILKCRGRALSRSFEKRYPLKIQWTFGLLYRSALYRVGINHRGSYITVTE